MLEFLSQCSFRDKPRQTTLQLEIPNLLACQAHKLKPLLALPSVKGLVLALPPSSLTKLAFITVVTGQSAHMAMSGATPEGRSDRLTKLTLVERAGALGGGVQRGKRELS
jgi:hypothetical protein